MLDDEDKQCDGKDKELRTTQTFFGQVRQCIATLDGWDTSIVAFPGNSGSPVLDRHLRVVGVLFATDSRSNFGSFIPEDRVASFLEKL